MLELVYPRLYVTIGGSLNISLGNNPAFLEGHFVRVELLEVIIMSAWLPLLSACNLWCLTPLFFASYFSLGSFIVLEGQSLEYSVNYLHFVLLRRGRARLFD